MFLLLVVLNAGAVLALESTQDTVPNNINTKGALGFYASINNTPVNKTYYEKGENPLVVPSKFYEEKKKKNMVKKSPKRTIQKIIKNGKNKSKKIYVHPITRPPTEPSENFEVVDRNTQRNEETRTERSHRRRPRKSSKVARYPMPFHKMQTRRDMNRKRNRRDIDRNDVYILKDLDEIEFLSKEKDYDIVKTHIQNYW